MSEYIELTKQEIQDIVKALDERCQRLYTRMNFLIFCKHEEQAKDVFEEYKRLCSLLKGLR